MYQVLKFEWARNGSTEHDDAGFKIDVLNEVADLM
jgi:hypothetical protein